MSSAQLQESGLYILLFVRGDPPVKDDFHWALYLHQNQHNGGTKYHIRGEEGSWTADHGVTKSVFKEFLLVGLFHIGIVPTELESHFDKQMRTYDGALNGTRVTCRIWVFRVLALLQKPVDGRRIFGCDDLERLEREIKDWGNQNAQSAVENKQPRPLDRSSKETPISMKRY